METLVIDRCTKMPGIIDRAKRYKIILNAKGLYLLCLGNATLDVQSPNAVAAALASKIIDRIADKFEQQARETEARLEKEGPDALASTSKSHFIPQGKITRFDYQVQGNGWLKLQVAGEGTKMALVMHPGYEHILALMKQRAGA